MKTYRVTVEHDDRFWFVQVPELDWATQARHLREVERMARDLIATMLDVPADSFDLDVQIELPASAKVHVTNAHRLRDEAAAANAEAARESRAAARELARMGLPLRDLGRAFGVSYQRAHQLVGK